MSGVDEQLAFVRRCLDDDEREINRHPTDGMPQLYTEDEGHGYLATEESNYPCDSMLTVGKRFALAKIKADRAILDECDSGINGWTSADEKERCRDILRLLAQPYAGREGWRAEWRA